jgi:hypothetical protein
MKHGVYVRSRWLLWLYSRRMSTEVICAVGTRGGGRKSPRLLSTLGTRNFFAALVESSRLCIPKESSISGGVWSGVCIQLL